MKINSDQSGAIEAAFKQTTVIRGLEQYPRPDDGAIEPLFQGEVSTSFPFGCRRALRGAHDRHNHFAHIAVSGVGGYARRGGNALWRLTPNTRSRSIDR